MSYSRLLLAASVAALTFLGVGVLLYILGPPATGFDVTVATVDVGEKPLGIHRVTYRIENPTNHPVRVIGNDRSGCGTGCRLYPEDPGTAAIAPHSTCEFVCILDVSETGMLSARTVLFLSDGDIHPVPIFVRGVGVPAAKETSGSPAP